MATFNILRTFTQTYKNVMGGLEDIRICKKQSTLSAFSILFALIFVSYHTVVFGPDIRAHFFEA